MGYQSNHPNYIVRVDGALLGETQFVIQAEVTYAPHLTAAQRESVASGASLEVLLGVLGEWEHGERLGAKTVSISVAGDDDLDRFFRKWPRSLWSPASPRSDARGSARSSLPRSTTGADP
jgi:hypothetical protein